MKGKEDKEEVLAWSLLLFPSRFPSPKGLNSPQPWFPTWEGWRGGAEDSEGHALGLSGVPALYTQEDRQMAAWQACDGDNAQRTQADSLSQVGMTPGRSSAVTPAPHQQGSLWSLREGLCCHLVDPASLCGKGHLTHPLLAVGQRVPGAWGGPSLAHLC